MPTYAYECKDCHHQFDVHQSFSEDSLTTCPECSGRLRKKFNTVGVVFKGSGFYRTDSRKGADVSKSASSANDASGNSNSKSGSGSSSGESSGQSSSSSSSGKTGGTSDSGSSSASGSSSGSATKATAKSAS